MNQVMIFITNLIVGASMALMFIVFAAYGITYSNAHLVAQDLGMTVNTMMSVPTPVQVQYQPDTADYLISISPRNVRVQGADDTGRHPLYAAENPSVTTGTAAYEPAITLVSNEQTIGFQNNRNRLSTFCNAIDVPRRQVSLEVSAPDSLAGTKDSLESSLSRDESTSVSDDAGTLIRLEAVDGDDLLIRYREQQGSRLPTEIACRAAVNAESQTQAFTAYNIQQDSELPEQTVVIEVGRNADVDQTRLGNAIATGITASTDDG